MIIPATHKMVSFDVTNMYTKIPRDEAIETIYNYLLDDPTLKERTKIPVDTITKLLQMTLSIAYFVWRGTFYEQTNGLPQGYSTSVPCAQSYMQPYEHKAVTHYNAHNPTDALIDILQCWYRQADDTFTSIHGDHIIPFHAWLNRIHPDIQWTYEVEKEGRLNMLDISIICAPDGSLWYTGNPHTQANTLPTTATHQGHHYHPQ
jgi:hypothetical protein